MLTDAKARSIAPGGKPSRPAASRGFGCIPPRGAARGKWVLRYVSPVTAKRRDLGLGSYPETGIAAARRLAFEARALISEGKDPIEARRLSEAERARRPPTSPSARRPGSFIRSCARASGTPSTAAQWIGTLETYVLPVIGRRKASDLRAADFAEALRPIWLRSPRRPRACASAAMR